MEIRSIQPVVAVAAELFQRAEEFSMGMDCDSHHRLIDASSLT
jgi:hypothetical protein